ncbi:MAG: ATP cone domain-containing protein [Planctomycetota bacterium]
MQRTPEQAGPLHVEKRDGRAAPFDAGRIALSVRRALQASGRDDEALAGDLASVVVTFLQADSAGRPHKVRVPAADIAALVCEVLSGAGCHAAVLAFRAVQAQRESARRELRIRHLDVDGAVRAIPPDSSGPAASATAVSAPALNASESWSKGRVVALLATEAALAPELAGDVAASVERTLFASGMRSISSALLREWVDNELALRGLPARLGRQQFVGLSPHELRDILASGAAGSAADAAASARLFGSYALREVFPSEVRQAHEAGRLSLENLGSGGRVDSVRLSAWSLPAFRAERPRRARLASLAPRLRSLAHLASREVLIHWDGPTLSSAAAAELLWALAEPELVAAGAARVIVCLPPDRRGLAAPFLDALGAPQPGLRGPLLRLSPAGLSPDLLAEAIRREAVDGRLQFSARRAADPEASVGDAEVVTSSVALNLARVALEVGPRHVREFLTAVEELAALALSALAAQEALMQREPGPLAALTSFTGLPLARLRRSRRLALCGMPQAASLLLGDGPRGRANRLDLAAALGERLARSVDVLSDVHLGLASEASRERLGRLDLAAFPDSRDRLPLAGHRAAFRYDGAEALPAGVDPAEAGAEAARLAGLLGLEEVAPVPRCTGGSEARLAYLLAYQSAALIPDLDRCA